MNTSWVYQFFSSLLDLQTAAREKGFAHLHRDTCSTVVGICGFRFPPSLLTVALFSIRTKFKTGVTHTAERAQHVDASMGTLGTARTALVNVYRNGNNT